MTKLKKTDYENICKSSERAKKSKKEIWHLHRKYCLDKCDNCTDLDIQKKIYFELKRLNEILLLRS